MDRETVTWIVAGAAAAGVGYYLYRRRRRPAEASTDSSAQQAYVNPSESNLVHFPVSSP